MLLFDVTKAATQGHQSGLMRTSRCLQNQLAASSGGGIQPVVWHARRESFADALTRRNVSAGAGDWLLTPELFSEEERPGFTRWLEDAKCGTAAVYHDAIPLRFPEFTWPKSVYRHPHYMKLLARFDLVFANSAASAAELGDYWHWIGCERLDAVAIPFGADGQGVPRITNDLGRAGDRMVAMLGILEPRKNQRAVLDAAEELWAEGVEFSLTLAGRVNPHFGRPVARRVRELR
ncbi:MAG: hypothetical protein ACREIA_10710, partial [Opitutaceae bacterium]